MNLWRAWTAFFEEEAEGAPRFDPVHLGLVLVGTQAVVGLLFWLLWTAMVYEGGFMTGEGRVGNFVALAIVAGVIEALRRADKRHARNAK